ncbi:MAG: Gfo/Idh/MocA family oxidoreductase [Acidobacteria bacterium]|nr:Gfo/Idh/MocA family oxidoreductase [Acidobacteriota bacterium]
MKELGVGVIGVGEMGGRHAENLRRHVPGAKLVAVADAKLDRARSVAAELDIDSFYESAEALVSHPDVQAVVISSPPGFHLPAIQAAAAAGKHILCEKPLTLTLEDADAALEAVHKAGVSLQVGHMRRYDPPYVEAKKRIEAGEIGQVVIFKSIGRDPESSIAAASLVDVNGTLFHDSSSHEFDLARWLTSDEIVEVHAYAAALAIPELKPNAFDSGVVNLRFAGGAIGNVESFMHARYGYDVRTEIVGTKGALQIGHIQQTPLVSLTRSGSACDLVSHWLVRFAEAYLREMTDFVQNILAGRPPRVSGLDGRQSVAVAVAAVQSCRESRPVKVSLATLTRT